MLEVQVPGFRNGHLYRAGEDLKQGALGYISGINTSGYFLIKQPTTCTQAALSVYPFKKLRFEEDLSDSADAVDYVASGDPLIVFENGGEYITNRFIHTSLTHSTSMANYYDTAVDITDTALYTNFNAGKNIWLYPSTAVGQYGWLTAASSGCTAISGARAALNRNILLTRAWSGMYGPFTKISFRILPNSPAFNGLFITTALSDGARGMANSPYIF